ncbi:hypothetical protein PsAD13_03378 [Pseudovibrio sp. Ad13]|nr:hypothetical protein PsAD13_03378 [Pseudovibrio sp. Ad13]
MRSTETFDIRRSCSRSSKSVNAKLKTHRGAPITALLGPMHI